MKCNICPRNCNVNRDIEYGFCKANNNIKIAKVMMHYWEEPLINGKNGSGAIFFSNCNLKCIYCQNYKISSLGNGIEITEDKLIEIFKKFESLHATNINLVTGTHYTLQIINALKKYKPSIPIVWNSSGYEKPETIKLLDGLIDIYLYDFKYFDNSLALAFSGAPDYKDYCTKCLTEIRRQLPTDTIISNIMQKGLIIRHLVLPNHTDDSIKILQWIKENLGTKTIISLMNQYTPFYKAFDNCDLKRKLKPIEYKLVLNQFNKLGFEFGFIQSDKSSSESFIPDFDKNTIDI